MDLNSLTHEKEELEIQKDYMLNKLTKYKVITIILLIIVILHFQLYRKQIVNTKDMMSTAIETLANIKEIVQQRDKQLNLVKVEVHLESVLDQLKDL